MSEQQNIEYKQSWHDEYLKSVCGFANAQGGTIYIGKDDDGNVVDVADYKKLMEEIPNKLKNTMGISAELNLHESQVRKFIEIITKPYSVPISLKGRYYYRSGSTKQELTGASLNDFLLHRSGKTWDDIVEPDASFDDIDENSVKTFLVAAENAGRLAENNNITTQELFENLRLSESGLLKKAAIILFGKDPGKFYPGIYVKIGRFGLDDADIIFQETEEGNLIALLQTVSHQLSHKFLKRTIGFDGLHRIEKGEYPVSAIREILLNALVHRNYMGALIQIHVYDDKLSVWNEGPLPEGLTSEALKRSHPSRPRNPIIADVAFRGGYIDAWGRGTIKIIDACKQADLPEPEMRELDGGFRVTLFKNVLTGEKLKQLGLNSRQIKAILFVKQNGRISNAGYQELLGVSKATATRDLTELQGKYGLLEKVGHTGAGTFYIQKPKGS